MEKKKVRCSLHFKRKFIQYYELLGYKLTNEINRPFSRVVLYFERGQVSDKVYDIELKYRLYPSLPFLPIIIASIAIVALTTLFLVFVFTHSEDKLLYFAYYMIPAFSLLLIISGYSYVRYTFDSKNIDVLTELNTIKKELGVKQDE